MSDSERETTTDDDQVLDDLDVGDDAEKVVGGRISCPCDGGEVHRPK